MANKIVWDAVSERLYETGLDRGVLYPISNGAYPAGYAWNGLTSITETPSGAEATALYADNSKYINLLSAEDFGITIEVYTYPKEFAACDGSVAPVLGTMIGQQARTVFGLCYRTIIGNDASGNGFAYKLHMIYGCLATPSEKAFTTINDSPEAVTFSWTISTTPVATTGYRPVSLITIDSNTANAANLAALEIILYGVAGSPGTAARLPLPDEIITLMTPA